MKSRIARIAVPVAALGILAAGGVTAVAAMTSNAADDSAFAVDHFLAPSVPAGDAFSQSVMHLWFGHNATGFTKVGGADWLSVNGAGQITGTAPASAPADPATITVQGTDGDATDQITIEVPVVAAGQMPTFEAASWNVSDDGSAAYSTVKSQLLALVDNDVEVVGLQGTDGTDATELARDLGWYSYQEPATAADGGDLGLVSPFPISNVVAPSATTPALSASLDIDGYATDVWVAHLDETAGTAAQAQAIKIAVQAGMSASANVPTVVLGDLGGATDAGTVLGAGLTDSYAESDPSGTAVTYPLFTTGTMSRIDVVDYAGPLVDKGAEVLPAGWAANDATSTWPSDHGAAVALFQLGAQVPAALQRDLSTISKTVTATPRVGSADKALSGAEPTVTGRVRVGETLTVRTGRWSPRPDFAFQWYAAGHKIEHATHRTLTLTRALRGKRITVRLIASKRGYESRTAVSGRTATVK